MPAVRLGKNHLRWCDECNLPVLESMECPLCGRPTREVEITPPGDARPAFPHDIELIRSVADRQHGSGAGLALIPDGHPVILNKAPSLDRMDEIVVDGTAVASLRYDMGKGWVLINRMQSAMRIAPVATKGVVFCEDAAVPFVQDSRNLMAPGVTGATLDVMPGDEVIVATSDRRAIATGSARMTAQEMTDAERGMAVKTKWVKPEELRSSDKGYTWDRVVEANRAAIERRRDEAVSFIQRTLAKHSDKPAVVSFSGGKDSQAVLLLTLDAGLRLPVLFLNTGLEFRETEEHVRATAERHGLRLIEERAPVNAFYGNLVHFGPPAKDYRWCCKTNKLGPTVNAIGKNFPGGVLSFIGQRKYESEARHSKPREWVNPWTPGQTGASPIQSWNSLHVWMYLFLKKEPFNVWYTRGLDRIGCCLCPASDLAEFETLREHSEEFRRWEEYLSSYREERGLPDEWQAYALWRWKRAPQSIAQEVERVTGRRMSVLTRQKVPSEKGPLAIRVQEGYSPCVIGYSIEAALSRPIDIGRLKGFLIIIGSKIQEDPEGQWVSVNNITVYREGSIISKANVEKDARANIDKLFELIIRSEQCVGCGLCAARCRQGALRMVDGRVEIDPDECIWCQDCLGPCPAVNFRVTEEEEL